jgi:hypothetical protein
MVTISNYPYVAGILKWISALSFAKKLLASIWLLFLILVAAGIHGSSTGITAAWWAPEERYRGYLFNIDSDIDQDSSRLDRKGLAAFLMAEAKLSRWDELAVYTPYALSQFSQQPRFPVVNGGYGNGQNMLVIPQPPVLHVATLARPATWGYFLLGKQRGLAWFWWFQVFGCFTVLFLLFQVLLKCHSRLAAFGAFWFCASAYSVCWSHWPAHATMFAALGCLSSYQIFASTKKSLQVISGVLLGLSIPGFVMIMYPAWQVQLGYLALVLFAGLVIRDKLYVPAQLLSGFRVLSLAIALILAGALTVSWLLTCLSDIRIMSNTVYPGNRVSVGGSYSISELFKGTYNLITIYSCPAKLLSQSEASSFYYLFPAIFLAIPFSRKLLRGLGAVARTMIIFILAMLYLLFVGVPASVAKISLLSYVPTYRADLSIGLASIILCLSVLAMTSQGDEPAKHRRQRLLALIVGSVIVVFFVYHGLALMKFTGDFPIPVLILLMALLMGSLSYALLAGRKRAFCSILGLLLVATTALFNPLATNLDHVYGSELATKIIEINSLSADRPLWLCYGGNHVGALVSVLGGRSLTGIQWLPQLPIWHVIDPERSHEQSYNSYNEVSFFPSHNDNQVTFESPKPGVLWVSISPNNPALRSLGARYVVLMGDAQRNVDASRLQLIHKSPYETFSIYEIPQ